jgi:hypothetical protein
MTLKNISGARQYFSFGSRGYNLDPDEEITFPYSTPGLAAHVAKYVDEGTMEVTVPPTAEEVDPHGLNPSLGSGGSDVSWAPTNINLLNMLGRYTYGDLPGITSITFNESASVGGFDMENTSEVLSLAWPNLVSVDLDNIQNGYFYIYGNSALTSVSLPLLEFVKSGIWIIFNPLLTSLTLPSLLHAEQLDFESNGLVTLSIPALTTLDGNFSALNNALDAASINGILARLVAANGGSWTHACNLSGSSMAAPTGAGISDYITLKSRGASISLNTPAYVYDNDAGFAAFTGVGGTAGNITVDGSTSALVLSNTHIVACLGVQIEISGDVGLTTVALPNLVTSTAQFFMSCPDVVSLDLSSLQRAGGIGIVSCNSITTVSLPQLVTCSGDFATQNCPLLTSVSAPNLQVVNGASVACNECALDAASVNGILARLVANTGYVSGAVDFSGGTNAAPTGQGLLDVATLISRGVSVNVNS